MAKYVNQKCVHCLKYQEKLTEDHIFPRYWYPDSTPADIEKWTVPSCDDCNKKLGIAEEDLFNRFVMCVDETDLAAFGLTKKVFKDLSVESDKRRIGRQIKFLMDTVKNFIPYPYEEGNQYVLKGGTPKYGNRTRRMVRIPGDKLHMVSEKIIRGLEFKLHNRLVEEDREICIIIPHEHKKEEIELINKWDKLLLAFEKNTHRGYGFSVRYGVNPIDENWSLYNVKIWNHLEIWAMIYPKDKKTKKPQVNFVESNKNFNLALERYRQNRPEECLIFLDISIALNPKNFAAHHTKALALAGLKRYEEGFVAIEEAVKLNPDNQKALSDKIAFLLSLEKYEEAIKLSDEVLKLNLTDHLTWHRKGIAFYHSSKFGEAIEAFTESLRLWPHNSIALSKKISALIIIGRYEEATKLFERSDLAEIDYDRSLNNIGFAYLQLGKYPEAEKYLNEARSKDSKEKIIYYNLYRLNFKTKRYIAFLRFFLRFAILFSRDFLTRSIDWFFASILKRPRGKERVDNSGRPDIFRGPGKLFSSDSQTRESMAIFKLLRTPHLWALCNDWLCWVAVNIPMDLLDKNGFDGDVDLVIAMPGKLPPEENCGIKCRAFEAKSIIIDKNGKVRSLGGGKHKRVLGQLKKLESFGCGQTFLLEIYIIERGYSEKHGGFPTRIIEDAQKKALLLKDSNFGYVLMMDEPSVSHSEEAGGMSILPINVLPTKDRAVTSRFLKLTEHLDTFYKSEKEKNPNLKFPTVICCCKKCKNLILTDVSHDNPVCTNCNKEIF